MKEPTYIPASITPEQLREAQVAQARAYANGWSARHTGELLQLHAAAAGVSIEMLLAAMDRAPTMFRRDRAIPLRPLSR